MASKRPNTKMRDQLSVKVGPWFKAHAAGRGVLAIPGIVAALAALEVVRILYG